MKVYNATATINNLKKQFKKSIKDQLDTRANSIVTKLKAVTPVDTGYARDSWKYSDNKITNSASYIDQLNSGSSQQAPRLFIESTVLSQPGVIPNGIIVEDL